MANTVVPSPEEVRRQLTNLSRKGREWLATKSGVPASTLKKIRLGWHGDPKLGTVHQFWPYMRRAQAIRD